MNSIMHQNVLNHRHSLNCKIVPKEKMASRTSNEITVKWLESKDTGKVHCLKMKHVIGEPAEIAVGAEVGVSFNVSTTVTDLFDWVPPENFTVSLSGCTAPASENPLLYCFL